jgi:hypothetical protein
MCWVHGIVQRGEGRKEHLKVDTEFKALQDEKWHGRGEVRAVKWRGCQFRTER